MAVAFIGALFLPSLMVKAENSPENLNINSVVFIEQEQEEFLDFDTTPYLPEGFNPYDSEIYIGSLNFIEDDAIELGFDTAEYLPENFNPYTK